MSDDVYTRPRAIVIRKALAAGTLVFWVLSYLAAWLGPSACSPEWVTAKPLFGLLLYPAMALSIALAVESLWPTTS